jgi:hypothetical protein
MSAICPLSGRSGHAHPSRKDRALTMAASRNVTVTESRSLTVVENAYCAYLAIANPNLAPVVTLFDRGFSFSASNFGHGGAGPWAGCYDHPVEELAPAMCGGFSYPAFLHRLQEKAPALAGGG